MRDWGDELWVKLYTRDGADWLAMPFDAQAVLMMILRKCDRAGFLDLGKAGLRAVPGLLGHTADADRILAGLEYLINVDGCMRLTEEGRLFWPNYLPAQTAVATDRSRQKASRERAHALGLVSKSVPSASRLDVTQEASRLDVTPTRHAGVVTLDASPIEEKRREEKETTLSPLRGDPEPIPLALEEAQPKKPIGAIQVFEHWKQRMGKNAATTFEGKRRASVEARLRRFSVEQLCLAVDGCALTPHNMGANERGKPFNDLELICRDAANVERFMETAEQAARAKTQAPSPPGFKRLPPGVEPYKRMGVVPHG